MFFSEEHMIISDRELTGQRGVNPKRFGLFHLTTVKKWANFQRLSG